MVFSFLRTSNLKTGVIAAFTGTAVTIGILIGVFFFWAQPGDAQPAGQTSGGLGITYVTVTPVVSASYQLGVQTGALITWVAPGSPAELAGVKAGDVIVTFNETKINEGAPLLGEMMACPAGEAIGLEVWRADTALPLTLYVER